MFQTFRLYTAFFEKILYFRLCESQRNFVFLMLLRKLRKVFVDLADSLIVAFLSQRIGQDLLKCLFLGLKGDRCRRTEAGINKFRVELLRIF